MSLHTVFHQGPHKPSTLKSHRGRAATGSSCPDLYNPVACQTSLSERGVPQARTLDYIGQYWLPYPSRALCFLVPQLPTLLRTRCYQNPSNPSSCTIPTPGPHRTKPKCSRKPQEQSPGDDPHAEVEIKPQLKPRGIVDKEEDPKPSHQLYKLQIKST